jgi:hypothetical protein
MATGRVVEADAGGLEHVAVEPAGKSNRFVKGPIPWNWLIKAAQLPGQALVLGLCLWRLKGATRKDTVTLSNTELRPFGIDRAAKSRGLAALEKAGLIRVDHKPGCWSNITLLT